MISEEFVLSPNAILAGHRVNSFQSVTSTNAIAMQFAKEVIKNTGKEIGVPNTWFVANEQTQGRGRRGRVWQSQQGNLAASLIVILPKNTPAPELLGFVAGIALAKTVKQLLGVRGKDVSVKWPNDLLLSDAKLAGILLESEILASGERIVIIGMGLNVKSAPEGLAYSTCCLGDIDPTISPNDVFTKLSENWVESFNLWDYNAGGKFILTQWRDLAAGIGHPIKIMRSKDVIEGIFETIDEQGHLIIKTSSGHIEKVTTGDVQF